MNPKDLTPLGLGMNIDDLDLMTKAKHQAETASLRNDLLDAQATIEKLRRELSNTVAIAQQDLAVAERRHADDIKIIGDQLIEEAEERDFCDAYDDVIRAINKNLRVKLREREQDYDVVLSLKSVIAAASIDAAGENLREKVAQALRTAGLGHLEVTVTDVDSR